MTYTCHIQGTAHRGTCAHEHGCTTDGPAHQGVIDTHTPLWRSCAQMCIHTLLGHTDVYRCVNACCSCTLCKLICTDSHSSSGPTHMHVHTGGRLTPGLPNVVRRALSLWCLLHQHRCALVFWHEAKGHSRDAVQGLSAAFETCLFLRPLNQRELR